MKRLLNTRFAEKVKKAIENKELTQENIPQWVTEYNKLYDKTLEQEVTTLYKYFKEV